MHRPRPATLAALCLLCTSALTTPARADLMEPAANPSDQAGVVQQLNGVAELLWDGLGTPEVTPAETPIIMTMPGVPSGPSVLPVTETPGIVAPDPGRDPVAVPEPGALALFGLGLLALGLVYRSARRAGPLLQRAAWD